MNYKDLEEINSYVETPFYLYHQTAIKDNYHQIKKELDERISVNYVMKANPNLEVIKLFRDLGSDFVCSSKREIEEALSIGIAPEQIILASPGKTYGDLLFAVTNRIHAIVVNGIEELEDIISIANKIGEVVNLALRVLIEDCKTKAGETFQSAHCGVSSEDFKQACETILEHKQLHLVGFHFYPGTQILKEHVIVKNLKCFFEYISAYLTSLEWKELQMMFSPGIGVDYYNDGKSIEIESLVEKINDMFRQFVCQHSEIKIQFRLFIGRFLVANAGIYVSKVLYSKDSYGKKFLVTDGGTNQISPTFLINRFLRRTLPVEIVARKDQEVSEHIVVVTGNLCTPTDVLMESTSCKKYDVDDYICIPNTGAYGKTYGVLDFLRHEHPKEIII